MRLEMLDEAIDVIRALLGGEYETREFIEFAKQFS
jgi:hypothetical protein